MSSSPEGKIVKTVKGKDIQYGFPKGTSSYCTITVPRSWGKRLKLLFLQIFVLFLKIQLENINTKHFRCKKCDVFNGQCVKTWLKAKKKEKPRDKHRAADSVQTEENLQFVFKTQVYNVLKWIKAQWHQLWLNHLPK